jgi:hypothetical protein
VGVRSDIQVRACGVRVCKPNSLTVDGSSDVETHGELELDALTASLELGALSANSSMRGTDALAQYHGAMRLLQEEGP